MAFVEEMVDEARALRYMRVLPTYVEIVSQLNSNGGKDPNAKKVPKARLYAPEELMRPWELPEALTPLRFSRSEAQAILDALPHLKNANWVFQALINRVLPLADIQRQAGMEM